MATIRDIARYAGVSVSTASLALNGDKRVRPATRERIVDAATSLDYHPMRAARSLSSGRTYSLQILNPVSDTELSSGFFTRFARGVHDLAREHRYSVALSILDNESEAGEILEHLILERWTDGVILMNPSENGGTLEQLLSAKFPHVVLGRSPKQGSPSVDNDNVQVACDATQHLLERGYAPILFLNGAANYTFTQDRVAGFREAHQNANVEAREELIRFIGGSAEATQQEVNHLLAAGIHFRSVLTVSDAQAVGAMHALIAQGLGVPAQVAVVGMNNDDITEYTHPRLSSIELNACDLGKEAAAILLEAIETTELKAVRRIVPHHLVLRESS